MKAALASENVEQMRTTVDALNQHLQTLGAQLYETPAAEGAPAGDGAQPGQNKSGEDVVDAEFTEA